jgi:hypothetical protein
MASLDGRHAVSRPRAGSIVPSNPLPPPSSAWAARRNSIGEVRRPEFARTPTARSTQRSPSSRSSRPDSSCGDEATVVAAGAASSSGLLPISPVSTVIYHRSRRTSIGEDPTVRRPITEAPAEALFSPPAPLAAAVPIPPPGTSAAAAVFATTRAARPNAAIDRDGTKRVLPSIRRSNTTGGDLAASSHSHAGPGGHAAGSEGDIPAVRFPLNKQMVSEKSAESLFGELQRVLTRQGMSMMLTAQPLALECATSDGAVRFDAEIVRIPRLNNMHGVHFRRRCGDASVYKTICKQLLELMQL